MRVGTGWDIHRLAEGRKLILGGVTIESPKGSVAHSDGDALIHAVIDSLLGACGLGDIGTFFPDNDPQYKDINSVLLLERTVEMVGKEGYRIVNVDTTVILQSPKLGPYKDAIRKKMAQTLGIDESCFCIKAKTAEHMLGELGDGDAVECQSVCLLE